jgi:hypothetical protein
LWPNVKKRKGNKERDKKGLKPNQVASPTKWMIGSKAQLNRRRKEDEKRTE